MYHPHYSVDMHTSLPMKKPTELIINDLSAVPQFKPPTFHSITIESVEISIQNLAKTYQRRRRWNNFLNPSQDHHQEAGIIIVASWRTQLAKFLESTPVHTMVILLLLLDLVITILELSSSLISSCKGHYISNNHRREFWYHWVGIAVLSLLSAKTIALGVGLGCSFFRRPVYMVDAVVVVGALILKALLEGKGGGLLVVVSSWRVVRVVESAFELSDEAIQAQIEGIVCQFEALKDENTRLLGTIAKKDLIIELLKEELTAVHGINLSI